MLQVQSTTKTRNTSKKSKCLVGFHLHVLFEDWTSYNEVYWREDSDAPIDDYMAFVNNEHAIDVVLKRRGKVIRRYDAWAERGNAPLGSNKPFSLMR